MIFFCYNLNVAYRGKYALSSYPISYDYSDDVLTQTWFIVLLGSVIALIVFLFGAMILIKRIQFIKQSSLSSIHGKLLLRC